MKKINKSPRRRRSLVLPAALLAAALATACSDKGAPAPDSGTTTDTGERDGTGGDGGGGPCVTSQACSAHGWCDEGQVSLDTFEAVWGSDTGELFAVGESGTVVHHDGKVWRQMASGTTAPLKGVWGSGPKDVYAVGAQGALLHYDGSSWKQSSPQRDTTAFNAVWGSGPQDVYVVGSSKDLLHYNGATWSTINLGLAGNYYFNGVWGSGPKDVYAVGSALPGYNALMVHYDGTTWTQVTGIGVGSYTGLWAIWGSGLQDIWVVGYNGRVLHGDGTSWSLVNTPCDASLDAVGGTGPKDVYIVGGYDKLCHFDGTTWTNVAPGAKVWLRGLWGGAAGQMIAVGQDDGNAVALRASSGGWKKDFEARNITLHSVWGSGPKSVFATGVNPPGTRAWVLHGDGTSWSTSLPPTQQGSLRAVWGASPTEVFAVAEWGAVYYYDGSAWHQLTTEQKAPLYGLWGIDKDHVFVVGHWQEEVSPSSFEFHAIVYQKNGAAWQGTAQQLAQGQGLRGVWGSGPKDVYAVGGCMGYSAYCGVIWRYDGSWKQVAKVAKTLYSVWGSGAADIFAVGESGTIHHYNGSSWSVMTSGTTKHLAVVWGSGKSDVYAVGEAGTILRYDGAKWTSMISGTDRDLTGVWGSGAANVYVVGERGAILHRCTP